MQQQADTDLSRRYARARGPDFAAMTTPKPGVSTRRTMIMHTQAPPPVDNQAALSADDLEAQLWRLFTGPVPPPGPPVLVPLLMGWAGQYALGQCRLAVAAADASHAQPLGLVHWRASARRTGCGQAAGTAACTDLPGEVTCRHNGCTRAGRR